MVQIKHGGQATSQWQELVKDAEQLNGVQLDEELESYLVFLLMRYTQQSHLGAKVMALEYLDGANAVGNLRREKMRDVGDQCLLYSGLFPRIAERRRVKLSYYVNLGRSAYHSVSESAQNAMARMFGQLAESFVDLMDILQAMRCVSQQTQDQDVLAAFELWQDTNSQRARQLIMNSGNGIPVRINTDKKH
jgi:hypothetical protein